VHLLRYRDSSTGVIGVGVLRRDTISTIPGVTSLAQLWRLSREDLKAAVTGATGEQCTLADVTVAAPTRIGRSCSSSRSPEPAGRRTQGRTVALVFTNLVSPYAATLIRGVNDGGAESGVDVVVSRVPDSGSQHWPDPPWGEGETFNELLQDRSAFEDFDIDRARTQGYGFARLQRLAIEHLLGTR
jgi:hypothetical protein